MRYFLMTILIAGIMMLFGCTLGGSSSTTGGVMKSVDAGKTFESRVTIDEKNSLARTNVLSMAIDPVNNSTVYIGTDRSGVYVSMDGALSWKQIDVGLSDITNVAISPINTQRIYVSGMYNGRGSVILTDDGGVNWRRVYVEPEDGTNITSMITSLTNGNIVYIGTSGGTIARTGNGGESWENLYHANSIINDLLIDASDLNTLYALVSNDDIVRTRDGGTTFESIGDLKRVRDVEGVYDGNLFSIAVSPAVSGVIFVGTDQGVFRSADYGLSWTSVDVIASTIGIPIHAIKVSPHDPNQLVYAAAKAVYTSVPGGWAITDTTSERVVDVIRHDPIDPNVVYIGLRKAAN
jgi:photosystem II stability/assembly factor-like uncharacterized protein